MAIDLERDMHWRSKIRAKLCKALEAIEPERTKRLKQRLWYLVSHNIVLRSVAAAGVLAPF